MRKNIAESEIVWMRIRFFTSRSCSKCISAGVPEMRHNHGGVVTVGVEIFDCHRDARPAYLSKSSVKIKNGTYISLYSCCISTVQLNNAKAHEDKRKNATESWYLHEHVHYTTVERIDNCCIEEMIE